MIGLIEMLIAMFVGHARASSYATFVNRRDASSVSYGLSRGEVKCCEFSGVADTELGTAAMLSKISIRETSDGKEVRIDGVPESCSVRDQSICDGHLKVIEFRLHNSDKIRGSLDVCELDTKQMNVNGVMFEGQRYRICFLRRDGAEILCSLGRSIHPPSPLLIAVDRDGRFVLLCYVETESVLSAPREHPGKNILHLRTTRCSAIDGIRSKYSFVGIDTFIAKTSADAEIPLKVFLKDVADSSVYVEYFREYCESPEAGSKKAEVAVKRRSASKGGGILKHRENAPSSRWKKVLIGALVLSLAAVLIYAGLKIRKWNRARLERQKLQNIMS